jgi:hypothetical protein
MSVIFTLKRSKGGSDFILSQVKNRYGQERRPLSLKIEGMAPEPITIVCSGEVEEAMIAESAAAHEILQYLMSERVFQFTSKQITPLFVQRGHSERAVKRAYEQLLGLGKIERLTRGLYALALKKEERELLENHPSLTAEGKLSATDL